MQKGIETTPDDPWPYYYLGLYEATVAQNFGAAIDHFGRAINLRLDDAKIRYHRGWCHEMLDQHDLAREDYEEALRKLAHLSAPFSLPYQGMARLLNGVDNAEALRYAELAVKEEPGLATNHLVLAKLYEGLEKFTEATDQLQAAAQADPTLASPHYQLYRLLSRQGKASAASHELAEFQKLKTLYGS